MGCCSDKTKSGLTYEALTQLPIVCECANAFRRATGISLLLLRPEPDGTRCLLASSGNPFCFLVGNSPSGNGVCQKAEANLLRDVAAKRKPQVVQCFAGSTVVAVPVIVSGQHVATLVGGPMARQKRDHRSFLPLAALLTRWGLKKELSRAKGAYLQTRNVTREQFGGILQLLTILARHLADYGSRALLNGNGNGTEPPCVAKAKVFAQGKVTGRVSLREAADHVHLNSFYFCKVFKKSTGMTFTEYVARTRVEKAKELLLDPFARVGEVAFEAGFGTIPHFNSVFRKYVGTSPTEYRATLRSEFSV